jgi:hypothetical protein
MPTQTQNAHRVPAVNALGNAVPAVDDGTEQQPGDIRAGDRADAEDAERHQRVLRTRLDDEERNQEDGCDGEA